MGNRYGMALDDASLRCAISRRWVRSQLTGIEVPREVLRSSVRAELRRTLIPLARRGGIGLNADSANALNDERVECLSKRKGGSGAACLSGAP